MFLKKKGLKQFLPFLLLLVLVPIGLVLATKGLGGRADQENLMLAAQSIRRAAVQCYALEGYYPATLDYLEERYGVSVNETQYFVSYQYVASNLMPDITVLPIDR